MLQWSKSYLLSRFLSCFCCVRNVIFFFIFFTFFLHTQKETLNERAVSVLARVQEKLTGRDQIAYRIGAKKILTGTTAGSDQSTSGGSAGGDAGGGSHQGQDQDVEDGDSSSNNEGMSSTLLEEPMAIAEQVDKLIIEAQSHENLSQLFIGWCPFW